MKSLVSTQSPTTSTSACEIGIVLGCLQNWQNEEQIQHYQAEIEASCALGYQHFWLARGDQKIVKRWMEMSDRFPNFTVLEDNPKNREFILRQSDVLLIPHKPTRTDISLSQKYQTIPLTHSSNLLENFIPSKESGNAFVFHPERQWDLLRSIVRAAENRQFGYDWGNLKKALGKV